MCSYYEAFETNERTNAKGWGTPFLNSDRNKILGTQDPMLTCMHFITLTLSR